MHIRNFWNVRYAKSNNKGTLYLTHVKRYRATSELPLKVVCGILSGGKDNRESFACCSLKSFLDAL